MTITICIFSILLLIAGVLIGMLPLLINRIKILFEVRRHKITRKPNVIVDVDPEDEDFPSNHQ